jgi:hypothetical protein
VSTGVSYAQATDGEAIEPLAAVAAPTPAVARQQAEQHPLDGRISMLHYLLALCGEGAAGKVLL